ncbi:MAG: hypothetical protein J0H96_14480 [Microbacterium ginsengisoli]|nr:hypothetical protein [Microbacterium ginsengisoli]
MPVDGVGVGVTVGVGVGVGEAVGLEVGVGVGVLPPQLPVAVQGWPVPTVPLWVSSQLRV